VARFITVLAVVGIAAVGAVSADSNSAQLAIGVTVVRSCAVDARPAGGSSPVRVTCTSGASSTLRLSQSVQKPAGTVTSDGLQIVTLNF
jgi:spore coat protein U-like protein